MSQHFCKMLAVPEFDHLSVHEFLLKITGIVHVGII